MPLRTIVYEDAGWQRLLPLVYMRAVFQLICGSGNLLARVWTLCARREGAGPAEPQLGLFCRPLLAEIVSAQTGLPANAIAAEASLFLNGRGLWKQLPRCDGPEPAWVGVAGQDQRLACICADAALAKRLTAEVLLDELKTRALLAGLPRRDVSACVTLIDWPWNLVDQNHEQLLADWIDEQAGVAGIIAEGSHVLNPSAVHVGWGTRVKPCVVIDAEDGPVWIGDHVTILPHSYIQGPAFIGDGSLIQPGAVVHAGTTIGPVCKVGGEIESSILHGYSNKQHDGFLGHSYVGSWINLAADCINSDLKNTYGSVRVPINGREVETGKMFVGMFVGDYSKAGINVSFPTGSVIGFCSSVFAARSPKFVPSFAWLDADSVQRYDELRGLAIAKKVMARRNRRMSAAEESVFLAVRKQALALEKQTLGSGRDLAPRPSERDAADRAAPGFHAQRPR
jgi:UDP-N-acetylglucosamine diphosphorylase/glucosamine-1-phosphate N-acetyltransferase